MFINKTCNFEYTHTNYVKTTVFYIALVGVRGGNPGRGAWG